MIKQLNKSTVETVGRPVRILQFGEGNFLRAFVDWQIDIANEKGVMDAGVAVCQPIIDPERKVLGMIDLMHRQDNMYHVYLEGIENKRPKKDVRLVKSVMDSFNPYVDYAKYEAYFLSPELKITISNTTEAGIRYEEGDDLTACPPKSYPAKMTALAGIFCTFPHPKITFFQAFFVELVITAVLMCLIYALVDGRNTAPKGNLGGLLIGLLVALIGASFGPLTGFAMNAARDFGPRLFASRARM